MKPTKSAASAVMICLALIALRAESRTYSNATSHDVKTFADSREGVQDQFAELIRVVRTNDESAIKKELDSLSIPDPNGWVASHFAAERVAQEQEAYQQAFKKFRAYIWSVVGSLGKNPEFALKVEGSQIAPPLSDAGFEGLVPRPTDAVKVENYWFISNVSGPQGGKPEWVSSFIYLDGRFRMIGGTFPFWAEGLNATRGPMSLPPEVIHGRTVQAQAFRRDVQGPGIEAIVHIQIEVGHDGKVKSMRVLFGDKEFIPDAKEYLKDGEYPKLPNDPHLANMRAIWDMEVVFFTTKPSAPGKPKERREKFFAPIRFSRNAPPKRNSPIPRHAIVPNCNLQLVAGERGGGGKDWREAHGIGGWGGRGGVRMECNREG
jgi:hypothetical protein